MPDLLIDLDLQLCPWLSEDLDPLQIAVCYCAHADIGILEVPLGSNRSGLIDRINRDAGAPVGSYWCASWVGIRAFRRAGAMTPPKGLMPSCDEWVKWAKKNNLWRTEPQPGFAVVYGTAADANHIGVVTRVTPGLCAVEGNTSLGGGFNRNGVAVDFKPVAAGCVLGYVAPRRAA